VNIVAVAVVGMATTFIVAWPLRKLALRYGILDRPGPRKSHREPIPYLGGVALVAGVGVALTLGHPHFYRVFLLMGLICALGLFDDLRHASVPAKLVAETAVALAAVGLGFAWQITDSTWLNAVISLIWIVGLSNSFNLLDNMDGLSSTAAAVPLVAFALIAPVTLPLAVALAAAAVGFLAINRPPARMYLGDAGSLTLGFGVALVAIAAANGDRGLHSVVLLAGPVALALFDTSLVIVSRLLSRRPVQLGGRDHFSHRLLLLGWSPYTILFATAAASALSGVITYLATRYPVGWAWLALPLAVAYAGAWLRLLRVDPYSSAAEYRPEVLRAENL
jgi:UDP-GlcNAc:undecaprenyl-phosphate/decaprenyl-phosphate GlcNAc-1-phosphate transferase